MVTTVRPDIPRSRRAISSVVVLPSSMTVWQPSRSGTAALAIACLAAWFSLTRLRKANSKLTRSPSVAPPWVRITLPSSAKTCNSRRIVMPLTPSAAANSATDCSPWRAISSRMWACRAVRLMEAHGGSGAKSELKGDTLCTSLFIVNTTRTAVKVG